MWYSSDGRETPCEEGHCIFSSSIHCLESNQRLQTQEEEGEKQSYQRWTCWLGWENQMAALVSHVGLVLSGEEESRADAEHVQKSVLSLLSSTCSHQQSSSRGVVHASDRPSTSSAQSFMAPHWRCYSNIISDTFLFVLSLSGYRRAAFKPQQIASVTLNACEQIALWNRKRAPAATSASHLWLETSLHYTSSKTYPLFMGPYFNTISTLRTTHLNTCMFPIKAASTVKVTSVGRK